jgi:hypothetical protein
MKAADGKYRHWWMLNEASGEFAAKLATITTVCPVGSPQYEGETKAMLCTAVHRHFGLSEDSQADIRRALYITDGLFRLFDEWKASEAILAIETTKKPLPNS